MISRRDFLKIAGMALAEASIFSPAFAYANDSGSHYGRILTRTNGFLPDSVHRIEGYSRGWVWLAGGAVPETHIQPMFSLEAAALESLPAYVMVKAPYAAVRQYCAADAPLLARPGHGAVLHANKVLDDRSGKWWLGVDLGHQVGWVQMAHVQALEPTTSASQTRTAILENQVVRIYQDDTELLRFAAAVPANLSSGTYTISQRYVGQNSETHVGIPWVLETDSGLKISGSYWHNRFACQHEGSRIELSALAAYTVFTLLPAGSPFIIR